MSISLRTELQTLGDWVKDIEKSYQTYLDPSKYTIFRLDGKSFSTFTRSYLKPIDDSIVNAMRSGTIRIMKEFNGNFAYTQSDECTMVIFPKTHIKEGKDVISDLPFKGRRDKLMTISASIFSVEFSMIMGKPAHFDCRVFSVDSLEEVCKIFYWRQLDAFRNGITNLADSLYSKRELHKKGTSEKKAMILEKVNDIEKYDVLLYGSFIKKSEKGYNIDVIHKDFSIKNAKEYIVISAECKE